MAHTIDLSARKITVPISKSTAAAEASVYPPELYAVPDAERGRAAQITAHLSICSTAINSVEVALLSLSTDEKKSIVDGTIVCLRAVIAQLVHSGPGSIPPSLPARPFRPPPLRISKNWDQPRRCLKIRLQKAHRLRWLATVSVIVCQDDGWLSKLGAKEVLR